MWPAILQALGSGSDLARSLLVRLPFIGYVFRTTWGDHERALREFCVAYLIGLFPIWVTFLVEFIIRGPSNTWSIALHLMSSSELFFASSALLSSYTYFLWGDADDSDSRGAFPHRFMFLLTGLVIIVAWSVIVSLDKALPLLGTTKRLDPIAISIISRVTFIASIVLMYLFLVFKNATNEGYTRPARADENRFLDEWEAQR